MLKAGNAQEAVARLTAMALDESYYDYPDENDPEPDRPAYLDAASCRRRPVAYRPGGGGRC